jgi:preprotein translocase subunit SecA
LHIFFYRKFLTFLLVFSSNSTILYVIKIILRKDGKVINKIAKKLFGTENERDLKKYQKFVDEINSKKEFFNKLSDDELKAYTPKLQKMLKDGSSLNDIMCDAFAVAREASTRVLGMTPFDVQVMGAIVLHKGKITEMRTGEGKTLVATMAVYLNALEGKGVHVVTVNDYLAKRDAEWMGKLYEWLGLSWAYLTNEVSDEDRKAAYQADILYATNNELGFDYLRDNMKFTQESMVQREFNFAIVDEVDSILIDEARTPLIISGPTEDTSEMYQKINSVIGQVKPAHYKMDEKHKNVILNEEGMEFMEKLLHENGITSVKNLYDIQNAAIVHYMDKSLTANLMFKRDVDYLVNNGEVMIIDEFTGRAMEGRRYSNGLHQAIEAKEGVTIQNENQTLASITYQNLFRLYPKLAGMTGTAATEAAEFEEIYSLKVLEIPTNLPVQRVDHDDEIYVNVKDKFKAVAELIKDCQRRGQPVLAGTISIEKSELLADILKNEHGIDAAVLNAKQHEREAYIVAQAGVPGSVTIATNMAGRGTDIKLGGNIDMIMRDEMEKLGKDELTGEEVAAIEARVAEQKDAALKAGGLYVIGTERHESRRIDNQLRGRSGRQGDPGDSKFFLCLEDDLMRIFGGDRLKNMLSTFGFKDGEMIKHKWISKALERSQRKVEEHHFDTRKEILKYDDVMNEQRKVVYAQRKDIMKTDDNSALAAEMAANIVEKICEQNIPFKAEASQWNYENIDANYFERFGIRIDSKSLRTIGEKEFFDDLYDIYQKHMAEKEANYGAGLIRYAEKVILLQELDTEWKDHLLNLDHLRSGINLRSYGQKKPIDEYKKEAFVMFKDCLEKFEARSIEILSKSEFKRNEISDIEEENAASAVADEHPTDGQGSVDEAPVAGSPVNASATPSSTDMKNVGRNEPCPCGSGKKFKHCHGKI